MNIPFVDLKAQYQTLRPEMDTAIQAVLEQTAFILGPDVRTFEHNFAAYIGTEHAIGVGSGTDALQLAMEALGIGPGDEVITAANTYVATCEAISHLGATPRLVDVDERSYNLDHTQLEVALSSASKAVIPVHLYGQPAELDPILDFARRHNLHVIEDCAQSHGARYKGRRTGTLGDVACFSFYPGKNLGAYGDGGAVLTNDDRIADQVRMLRNHGQKAKYEHLILGYCTRLDNLQAAVLNVKLPHLEEWNSHRRSRAALYDRLLGDVPNIVTPLIAPENEPVFHLYVIQATDGRRDALQGFLGEAGIATGLHYPTPVHLQKAYAHLGHKPGDFPVSEQLAQQGLSLPMFPELADEQVQFVSGKISEFMD